MMGSLWNCTEGANFIYLTFYYRFVSKDWYWPVLFGTCLNLLVLFIHPFVPESPKYLYDQKRYGECNHILKQMTSLNQVRTPTPRIDNLLKVSHSVNKSEIGSDFSKVGKDDQT